MAVKSPYANTMGHGHALWLLPEARAFARLFVRPDGPPESWARSATLLLGHRG